MSKFIAILSLITNASQRAAVTGALPNLATLEEQLGSAQAQELCSFLLQDGKSGLQRRAQALTSAFALEDLAEPEAAKPEAAKPVELAKPEVAKPVELAKPEVAKPVELAKPEAVKAEEPTANKPELVEPAAKPNPCTKCKGTGQGPGGVGECSVCGGSGQQPAAPPAAEPMGG